jgi:hypothetical protein
MDCESNERLLALHAGGDLPDRQARALAAHLQACDACRHVASDFAAGRELLGLHEPPEFDAAFFDRIRQNVLREIDDAPPPPAFARLTAILFGRRALALAACIAFLVAAGSLALYLRERREAVGSGPRQLAGSPRETQTEPAAPVINSPAIRDDERQPKPTPTIVAPTPHRRQLIVDFRRATRAKRDARMLERLTHVLAQDAVPNDTQAAGATSPGAEAAAASEVAVVAAPAERKMLRIELQTGDPNVRIIWLSPQEPEKHPR